jgi:hypothetical protein
VAIFVQGETADAAVYWMYIRRPMATPCGKTRPVPLGGEAVPLGFKAEALAAFGLRPEDVISGLR